MNASPSNALIQTNHGISYPYVGLQRFRQYEPDMVSPETPRDTPDKEATDNLATDVSVKKPSGSQ